MLENWAILPLPHGIVRSRILVYRGLSQAVLFQGFKPGTQRSQVDRNPLSLFLDLRAVVGIISDEAGQRLSACRVVGR